MGDLRLLLDLTALAVASPIAVYILISGLDDLWIDCVWLWITVRAQLRSRPAAETIHSLPQKKIAVVIPAWREYAVIQQMLEHNGTALDYENYDFFVGIYPNDPLTLAAVESAGRRLRNVQWAMVPHPGPTSKGDCLNWIYQNLLEYEQSQGTRYDLVLLHDAEDIIHPQALRWANYYGGEYGFLQIPVLALQTPWFNLTHGVYCDEFAETQTRDLPVRAAMGAFVPSSGVGTAITRRALDDLALHNQNRVFEPDSLTEDYEIGLSLKETGCKQMFLPIQMHDDDTIVATREYFPTDFHTAIRQRTRWVTGIALQTWQRHGWRGNWMRKYWFWRDRKGLIGSPLSLLTSVLLLYGLSSGLWTHKDSLAIVLMPLTTLVLVIRLVFRMGCTARIYGPAMAYLAPVRVIWGNAINGIATVKAIYRFFRARQRKERLAWLKTEHQYPSREALLMQRRRLGDLLIKSKAITREQVEEAMACRPEGMRLGEHLLKLGWISEEQLYQALSLQQQVPVAEIAEISPRIGRSLPSHLIRERQVLPFRIEPEGLAVCSPEPPNAETLRMIAAFTRLEVRFYLMPPTRFRALQDRVLAVCV
jgi:bacteriophage N4 adsorption protein B